MAKSKPVADKKKGDTSKKAPPNKAASSKPSKKGGVPNQGK